MRRPILWLAPVALLPTLAAAQETKKTDPEPSRVVPAQSATDPVARDPDGWWMRRHEQIIERIRPGTARLIFLGDSITQNWEGAGQGVWDRYYLPRKAVNLGIGADRTQHILWRLDHGELVGLRPDVAVVLVGTNNLASNPPAEVAAGIKAVVAKVRDRLPETKILLLGIFPRGQRSDPVRDRIRAVNDEIKSLDDGRFVHYLDLSSTFLEPDGTVSREVMPDSLHLSPKGYRLWAEAIEPTLWEMMGGK
jgi:lysophospholipase L1-like esterase